MMTAISLFRSTVPRVSPHGHVNLPRTVELLLPTTRACSVWSSSLAQVHQDKPSELPLSVISDGSVATEISEKVDDAAASALDNPSSSAPPGAAGALQQGPPITIWKSSQAAAPRSNRKGDDDEMTRSEAYATWMANVREKAPEVETPRREPSRLAAPRAIQGQSLRTRFSSRPDVAPGTKEYFRFARLFNLHPDTTLVDIVKGIMKTAPVGRVLDVAWEAEGRLSSHRGQQVRAAYVLFDHDASPVDLQRLAKQGTFRVAGASVHVSIYYKRAFHSNVVHAHHSRVLSIRGRRDMEGFSEDAIRELLLGNEEVVKALGPLGLDAESVKTIDWGNTQRFIEWRFLSSGKQFKVVLPILRRHFQNELSVLPGPDPCWNERLYPRKRMSTPYHRHLSGISEANKIPGPRKWHRSDGVVKALKLMTRWDPADMTLGYEPNKAGHDVTRKEGMIHLAEDVEDPTNNRTEDAWGKMTRSVSKELNSGHDWGSDFEFDADQPSKDISHEPNKARHDASRTENTMPFEDDVEWEDDEDDPMQQRIKELMAPYQPSRQSKPFDSTQRDRIEDWARLKRTMEQRHWRN